MYYNITIKSNGSEYSLTSDNKEVTQREMDLYFASFFGASEEFKSKIKKVEIRYPDIKSINDIENNTHKPTATISQTAQQIAQNQTTVEPTPTQTIPVQPVPTQTIPVQPVPTQTFAQPTPAQQYNIQQEFTQTFQPTQPNIAQVQQEVAQQPYITQTPVQQASQININQNYKANSAEINDFLNDFIVSSLEPSMPKNIMESIENTQPYASISELSLEQIEEEYEHQKEILEIKFDNAQDFHKNFTQPNYTEVQEYSTLSQDIEINITEPVYSQEPSKIDYGFKEEAMTLQTEAPAIQNDIDELLSLAQNKLNTLDSDLNFVSTPNIQIEEQKIQTQSAPSYSLEETNQEKIQNIFNNEQTITQKAQEFNVDTLEEEYENTPAELDIKNETEFDLNNISISIQPSQNPINYQEAFVSQMPTTLQYQTQENIQQMPEPTQTEVAQIAHQTQQISSSAYQQDFKLYLSQYKPTQTSDTFLICAFYIKNILKQENFTMKFINSKLFQATGTIADMGIVDDLLSKEYIRIIDSPDSKKYCITSDGEGYFVSRLSL